MADPREALDLDRAIGDVVLPRFTAGGHEYVGRMVSWRQATAWGKQAQAVGAALAREADGAEALLRALVVDMARALFPDAPAPIPPPWWKRWQASTRVPPAHEVVAGLHETHLLALLQSFSAALTTMLPAAGPAETRETTTKNPKSRPSAKRPSAPPAPPGASRTASP